MIQFSTGLSRDMVLEFKATLLNKHIDISRFMVYMRHTEDKKKVGRNCGAVKQEALEL